MLSPGQHHLKVPRNQAENLRFRRWLLGRAEANPRVRQSVVDACTHDILFYVNTFVYQYNSNKEGREAGPFITWDFQGPALHSILNHVEARRDLAIEKSREMGATWLCVIAFDWLHLFHPWKQFLMMSRSQAAVDSPSANSLFWKLRFMHKYLPEWLVGPLEERRLYFGCPRTGSSITGEASTGKAGVGGRATAMFIDEFSQIDEDREVWARTADTTRCRIFNFTHTGVGTMAYELSQFAGIDKLRMHWSQHPDKNPGLYRLNAETRQVEVIDKTYSFGPKFDFVLDGTPTAGPYPGLRSPWYDDQCVRRKHPRAIAMDLDINPHGSMEQFFNPLTISELQRKFCCDPVWRGDVRVDMDTGTFLEFVPCDDGPIKLWCNLDYRNLPPLCTCGAGADISAGTGSTPSCLSFVNRDTGEKILEYTNAFIVPEKFAPVAHALCQAFPNSDGDGPLLAWESPGPGSVFGQRMVGMGYRRIYYRRNDAVLGQPLMASPMPGWYPGPDQKRSLLTDYRHALEDHRFLNRSFEALKECLEFEYTRRGGVEHGGAVATTDPTLGSINHGDHVIADALAWKMVLELGQPARSAKPREVEPGSLAWRRELRDGQRRMQEAWA